MNQPEDLGEHVAIHKTLILPSADGDTLSKAKCSLVSFAQSNVWHNHYNLMKSSVEKALYL